MNNLYHQLYEAVKDLPIIDYHNHLSVSDIQNNTRFTDVYALWLQSDPYKHRLMRMCGVPEAYITGDKPDFEKFKKWCEIFPSLFGTPVYEWSINELSLIFGIKEIPNRDNAEKIYRECNAYLAQNPVTIRSMLERFKVECACPCVSLCDDLSVFRKGSLLVPSLRGDDIVNPTQAFVEKLEAASGKTIADLNSFEEAVKTRLDSLLSVGCKFSDHALDNGFMYYEEDCKNSERFQRLLEGALPTEEKERLGSYLLTFLAKEYESRQMILQLHIGAKRDTGTVLRKKAGPAGGYAGIGNSVHINSLTKFIDTLDLSGHLPKMILFTLNPADHAMISVLSGSYSKDNVKGLITEGPAWWWCDHRYGIEVALENIGSFSLLSNFVGMTTDSRSVLSFVRHDYFRRILCRWLEKRAEECDFDVDTENLKQIAKKMCYYNVKEFF